MNSSIFQQACLSYLNIPYVWGGDDPMRGFDCSGLVQELLSMIGLDPAGDQNAQGLHDHFVRYSSEGVLGTGSICFYGSSVKAITHVAMMIDNETIIEAGGGGSKTVDLEAAVKQNAYIRLRPYNRRKDLVAVLGLSALPWNASNPKP